MKYVNREGLKAEIFKAAPDFDKSIFDKALQSAVKKIEKELDRFTYVFPGYAQNNVFNAGENVNWTPGFWTGIQWICYEATGKEVFKKAAEIQVDDFIERIEKKIDVDHHDMGFLYSLSCIPAYKLTGSEKAKDAALKAADQLMSRLIEKAGIIQSWSWGKYGNDDKKGNVIIDSLMNTPLLYWASEITGDKSYREAALKHALTTVNSIVREDASTYHMYYFDPVTGNPRYGETAQGYANESCWARGQSWGIYGCVLNYVYTKDEALLEMAKKLADYFINRTPEDLVAYWDLVFKDGEGQLKDSSASAITVCGLLEMIKWLPAGEEKSYYQNAAMKILHSLCENYSTMYINGLNALLLHTVGSIPHNMSINEPTLFGDYFYMEALIRVTLDWKLYW